MKVIVYEKYEGYIILTQGAVKKLQERMESLPIYDDSFDGTIKGSHNLIYTEDKEEHTRRQSEPHINLINSDGRPYGRQCKYYTLSGDNKIIRTLPAIIKTAEEMKEDFMRGEFTIVDIPDNVDWYVSTNNKGYEIIREQHQVWGAKKHLDKWKI